MTRGRVVPTISVSRIATLALRVAGILTVGGSAKRNRLSQALNILFAGIVGAHSVVSFAFLYSDEGL